MRERNTRVHNTLTVALALAALVTTALNLFTGRAAADDLYVQAEQPPPGFGLVTLAPGQDMRLNVVNTALVQPDLPPNPCIVRVSFFDGDSNPVGDTQTAVLAPGQSLSAAALAFGGRTTARLRPVVQIAQPSRRGNDPHLPPNPCVSTLEVFDVDSGRTALLLDRAERAQPLGTRDGR